MLYKKFIEIALSPTVPVIKDSPPGSTDVFYPPTITFHFSLGLQIIEQVSSGTDIYLSLSTIKDEPIKKQLGSQISQL